MEEVKNEGLEVVATFDGLYLVPIVIMDAGTDLCRHSEALTGYAVRDARIDTLTEWYANALNVINECSEALPGVAYMDQPDGGSVSVQEQVRRMRQDCHQLRAELAAIKAQEPVAFVHPEQIKLLSIESPATCTVWNRPGAMPSGTSLRVPLYAAPVQQVSVPDCFESYRLADKFCEQRLVTDDHVRAIVVDAFASGYGFGIAAAPVAKQVVMQSTNFTASNGEQRNPRYQGQFEGETHGQAVYRLHWVTAAIESERLNAADQEGAQDE